MAPAPSPRVTATPAALESASLELQRLFATLDPAEATPTAHPTPKVATAPTVGPVLPFSNQMEQPRADARFAVLVAGPGAEGVVDRGGDSAKVSPAPGARIKTSGTRSGLGQFLRTCGVQGIFLAVTGICGLGAIAAGIALEESGLDQRPLRAMNLSALEIPAAATEVPLLERGLRQMQRWQRSAGQWLGSGSQTVQPEDLAVSPDDRQAVEQELARLQQESHQIFDQVIALEQQLGLDPQGGSLDVRLERLQELLNPSPGPVDPLVRMTLPSDALFGDSEVQLRPDAYRLLGPVIADLRRYPGAQVTIAAHTDDIGSTEANLTLSLRRSRVLTQYLENHLGSQYRWNTLGYGESQPLVDNSTNSNRQRNRRLEIQITP